MCLWEIDASTTNSRFRVVRTVEEESGLVSEAWPSSTKYKDKWSVESFREYQRTRSNTEISGFRSWSVFKDYDSQLESVVEDNLEDMDALSFNYWLGKFFQKVANKKGGRYPLWTLYGIVCGLKRHLE